ncbi:MAG: hypothetical protein HY907_22140 [Deltaproteobacteria bacterium]|nr:hypothetical protein [Deltaproteobacteria bacterium]
MRKVLRGALALALWTCPAWAVAQGTNPDSAATTEAAEEEEPLPYRGTSIVYENSFTAISLNPDYEPDYNPSYLMTWAFNPRYYLYDTLSARLGFSLDLELTDSDTTQQTYEPWVSDISLGFIYSTFYTIPVVELKLGGGVTFGFPTSKLSQARSLYLSLAPSLSIRRSFDVLGGLQLSYGFKYTKNFNKYSGMVTEDELFPCISSVENQTECFNMGMRNPSMSFSNTFEVQVYWLDRLYTTLSFGISNTLLYPVADAQVEIAGEMVDVPASEDNTDMRGSFSYLLEVGYDAWDFLSFAVGVSTVTAQLADDGSYRPPFINRFSAIYFDIALSVDGLVTTIEDMGEDDGGDTASSADVGAVAAR